MGWLRRGAARLGRRTRVARENLAVDDTIVRHLTDFIATHRGVEAFVEPQTAVTQTTMLLVAWDGEWTRRKVPSPAWAHAFAEHMHLPHYDAAVVGYPQRMRDYNSRRLRGGN
ncbi:hypothetical protein FHX74_002031 [Friedmanniella endophytica]|uniref:Uncharacterized protein n=1 Tax=Microlunatus kandeliicorticis TaxID=1759536 RepID=A0A7W3P5Z5_9ACTN|nr:hypothetical protein [Microlunatus kandeliicorticis]MBA8794412.1 hypothetical protein [Microlunatus kandeliicorticis]